MRSANPEWWCKSHELQRLTDSEIDALPDSVARRTAQDNEFGIKHCGW